MVKVSIIVPVYNVEKYIKRCVDSLLNQTFEDYELVFINDGSKDNSLEILNTYKSNSKIRIYTQSNKGPALTRNRGIKLASGKYIMFIDSDDYVDSDYIEKYYNAVTEGDYDLVIGGYKKLTGTKVEFIRKLTSGEFSKYIVMGPVCKMYSKKFLIDNKIEFLNTTASEDIYFNVLAYSNNPKINIITDTGYYYCYNSTSISNTLHKGFNQNVDIIGLVTAINYKNIENVELNQYFIIRYLIWYLLYSGKGASSKDFMHEYDKLFKWLKSNIPNYRRNKYIYFKPKGEFRHIHLLIRIFIILDKIKLVKLFSKIYCRGGVK